MTLPKQGNQDNWKHSQSRIPPANSPPTISIHKATWRHHNQRSPHPGKKQLADPLTWPRTLRLTVQHPRIFWISMRSKRQPSRSKMALLSGWAHLSNKWWWFYGSLSRILTFMLLGSITISGRTFARLHFCISTAEATREWWSGVICFGRYLVWQVRWATSNFVLFSRRFSCCVDEVAAQHVDADLIVHYGHACLSQWVTIADEMNS